MKTPLLKVLLAAVVLLIIGSCRCNVVCDCLFPAITVNYESDSLDCPGNFGELTSVAAYSAADGSLISNEVANRWECTIQIPFERNRFWVVTSDSLDIADTIRVDNVTFVNSSAGSCCDCGEQINTIELDINGDSYLSDNVERKF